MKTACGTLVVRFLLFFTICTSITINAQENANEIEVLVLTNAKSNKEVKIKSAKRVRVWLSDEVSIKGRLQDIQMDAIVIDNQLIALSQIKKIRIGSTGTKIIGGTIMGGGLIFCGIGVGIIAGANSASGCLGPAVTVIAGVLISGTGGFITLLGLPVFLIGKRFDLEKKWKISTALMAD